MQEPSFVSNLEYTELRNDLVTEQNHTSNTPVSITAEGESSISKSLPNHLRILFALNGGIEALPMLAYSSIINDRIAIEPAYIPAYYAVEFLPYSLKPLFGIVTKWIISSRCNLSSCTNSLKFMRNRDDGTTSLYSQTVVQQHNLLGGLLIGSSIMIATTSLLKTNQISACFLIAFGRGVFTSWAEFLVGVSLISTARASVVGRNNSGNLGDETQIDSEVWDNNSAISDESNFVNTHERSGCKDMEHAEEEKTISVYQSQAAFSRNVGSLLSQTALACLFLYRQYKFKTKLIQQQNTEYDCENSSNDSKPDDIAPLSPRLVTVILLVTSMLPLISSYVALRYRVGSHPVTSSRNQDSSLSWDQNIVTLAPSLENMEECSTGVISSNRFDEEKKKRRDERFNKIEDHRAQVICIGGDSPLSQNRTAFQCLQSDQSSPLRFGGMKYDLAALLLFQLVLITIALRTPITSITSSLSWYVLLTILAMGMIGTISCSYSCNIGNKGDIHGSEVDEAHSIEDFIEGQSQGPIPNLTNRLKRVALYLILRHSIPSAGVLLSSYFYSVFQSRPFYLQIISILESTSTTLSSWFYGRRLAERFSGLSKIATIIVSTTVLCSLFSLLNIPIVHVLSASKDGEEGENGQLSFDVKSWVLVIVICVQILGSFFAELSFLPSVILASSSIISYRPNHEIERSIETDEHNSVCAETSTIKGPSDEWIFDDGIRYAILISSIDFGGQLSDWTSIPLIQALNIQRENGWESLDLLIAISALIAISSLMFLKIIDR